MNSLPSINSLLDLEGWKINGESDCYSNENEPMTIGDKEAGNYY